MVATARIWRTHSSISYAVLSKIDVYSLAGRRSKFNSHSPVSILFKIDPKQPTSMISMAWNISSLSWTRIKMFTSWHQLYLQIAWSLSNTLLQSQLFCNGYSQNWRAQTCLFMSADLHPIPSLLAHLETNLWTTRNIRMALAWAALEKE